MLWQVLRFWLSSLLLQVREAVPIFIIVLTDGLVEEVESVGKLIGYIDSLPSEYCRSTRHPLGAFPLARSHLCSFFAFLLSSSITSMHTPSAALP